MGSTYRTALLIGVKAAETATVGVTVLALLIGPLLEHRKVIVSRHEATDLTKVPRIPFGHPRDASGADVVGWLPLVDIVVTDDRGVHD